MTAPNDVRMAQDLNRGSLSTPTSLTGPILTYGFGVSVAVWVAAFVTHLPWINLEQRFAGPAVLGVWVLAAVWVGRAAPRARHALITTGSGLLAAVLGLLILGAMLTEPVDDRTPAPGASGLIPNAGLIALGFVALGGVIGFVGGQVGKLLKPAQADTATAPADWLARLAVVAVFSVVPLLIVGGAVTSTRSGMAIIGWPDSFEANMFLYPVSLMAHPARFFEHTHRLLGSLVGLTTFAMMVYTFVATANRRVRVYAVSLFVLVVAQGIMGGVRVRMGVTDPKVASLWALAHGVCAQVFFAAVVAFAARVRPGFARPSLSLANPKTRRAATLAMILLPAALLQLAFGATYRHLGQPHALWSHIGFSVVVMVLALLCGFTLGGAGNDADNHPAGPGIRRTGNGLAHATILQFVLGWAALWAVGWGSSGAMEPERRAADVATGEGAAAVTPNAPTSGSPSDPSPAQNSSAPSAVDPDRYIPVGHEVETAAQVPIAKAIVKTVHQANGALVLAMVSLAFVWSRWAAKGGTADPTSEKQQV